MNQSDCSGKTLKLWPVFVDHFSITISTRMLITILVCRCRPCIRAQLFVLGFTLCTNTFIRTSRIRKCFLCALTAESMAWYILMLPLLSPFTANFDTSSSIASCTRPWQPIFWLVPSTQTMGASPS